MTFEKINSVMKFTYPAKTNDCKDYKKSNIGKYTGTVLGAGVGAKLIYTTTKLSKSSELKRFFIPYFESMVNHIDNFLKQEPLPRDEFRAIRAKALKCGLRIVPAAAVLVTGIGLGLGAVADSISNCINRKSADKKEV